MRSSSESSALSLPDGAELLSSRVRFFVSVDAVTGTDDEWPDEDGKVTEDGLAAIGGYP